MTAVDCAAFDDGVTDLALGFSPEPTRSALLAHAADCARCTATLDDLGRTVDGLVDLAPEAEPPVGFESRAVAAMRGVRGSAPSVGRPRRTLLAAAVAAVVLLALGVVVGGQLTDDGEGGRTPSALIRTGDGEVLGRVELASSPSPKVVVTIDGDDWRGTWVCELQRPDGSWVEVGQWTAGDAPTGAWAAPIDRSLLDATAMRITAGDDIVVATSGPLD